MEIVWNRMDQNPESVGRKPIGSSNTKNEYGKLHTQWDPPINNKDLKQTAKGKDFIT